ncbi:MAG: FAD-dependent oxidoreductase [Actinomycetota bacterium]|nr:FAD-dependent oxidoreductase [Actinomycetota bacterium]
MNAIKEYDVIICGGGTSGCSAAISAARAGANTLLIERIGSLGGQMNISGPPGFAYAHFFNPLGEQDIGGIMEETYNRLYKSGHALPHIKTPIRLKAGYTFSYIDPDWWGLMIFEMMTENNVNLLLHSLVVDVLKEGNIVKGVVVENANGRVEIPGKIVIDCTGEGDIAARAGAPFEMASREEIQPHTVSFTVDGVDWDKLCKYIRENPEDIEWLAFSSTSSHEEVMEVFKNLTDITELGEVQGFFSLRDKALAKGDWHKFSGVGFFLMPREGGRILAHLQHSSQVPNVLPTDAWDLTRGEIECRRQILIAWRFFKNYMPGFENAYITRVCPEMRIREGRRIMGDYKLTTDDVRMARKFDDVIGKSHFPSGGHHLATVDTLGMHDKSARDRKERSPEGGGSYDLPYRILVPQKVENMLVAGKMVSTDRDPYLRFLQQTMVTGQAAGVAAAICATRNITPRDLEKDVSELQRILTAQGAILKGTH